jgi:stage V sporulation protein K
MIYKEFKIGNQTFQTDYEFLSSEIFYFGVFNRNEILELADYETLISTENIHLGVVIVYNIYYSQNGGQYHSYVINISCNENEASKVIKNGSWSAANRIFKYNFNKKNNIIRDSIGIISEVNELLFPKEIPKFNLSGGMASHAAEQTKIVTELFFLLKTLNDAGISNHREADITQFTKEYISGTLSTPVKQVNTIAEAENSAMLPNVFSEIIGLKVVKNEISSIIDYAKIRKQKMERGLMVTPSSLHMVFTGNPGTGKTTIARKLGEVYKEIGLLSKGHLVEANRSDLVGEYVGHTAIKVKKVFESALNGVLFIDEAYTLVNGGQNDYGKEAINELLVLMENHREKVVVVVAGYPSQMKSFIDSNPGLDSRFPTKVHFDDYDVEELVEILISLAVSKKHLFTNEAKIKAELFMKSELEKNPNFGNARGVRNLFEKICKLQSIRLARKTTHLDVELLTFEAEDIPEVG